MRLFRVLALALLVPCCAGCSALGDFDLARIQTAAGGVAVAWDESEKKATLALDLGLIGDALGWTGDLLNIGNWIGKVGGWLGKVSPKEEEELPDVAPPAVESEVAPDPPGDPAT